MWQYVFFGKLAIVWKKIYIVKSNFSLCSVWHNHYTEAHPSYWLLGTSCATFWCFWIATDTWGGYTYLTSFHCYWGKPRIHSSLPSQRPFLCSCFCSEKFRNFSMFWKVSIFFSNIDKTSNGIMVVEFMFSHSPYSKTLRFYFSAQFWSAKEYTFLH